MKLEPVFKAGVIGVVVFGLLMVTFLVLNEDSSGVADTLIAAIDGLVAGLVAYAIQVLQPEPAPVPPAPSGPPPFDQGG